MNKISTLSPGLAREYSAGSTYEVGQYALWRNAYWKCSTAIPVPEEWTPDHWTQDDSPLDHKADLVDGKVPAAQLPSYVDDILEYDAKDVSTVAVFRADRSYPAGSVVKHGSPAKAYAFTAAHPAGAWTGEDVRDAELFPATGEKGKIYVALNTDTQYRWSGSAYVELAKYIPPYASSPEMDGRAYAGSADSYARGDHRHPTDTSRASVEDATLTEHRFTAWAWEGTPPTYEGKEVVLRLENYPWPDDPGRCWIAYTVDGEPCSLFGDPAARDDDNTRTTVTVAINEGGGYHTATRTALQGYILGPDDPSKPNYDKPIASEAEAEALRTEVAGKASTAAATLTERGFSAWVLADDVNNPITGEWLEEWQRMAPSATSGEVTIVNNEIYIGGVSATAGQDVSQDGLSLVFNGFGWANLGNALGISVGDTVATRTVVGYVLGSQTDKPLASEAEAEALRTGKQSKITASGILKGDGAGGVSAATSGTDYQAPLGFTPEDVSNKVTSLTAQSTDTQYPSAKCVYDALQGVDVKPTRIYNAVGTDALDDKGQLYKSSIPGASKFLVTKNGTTTEWPFYRYQSEGNAFSGHSVYSYGTWFTDLICYDPTDVVVGYTHYDQEHYARTTYVWDVQVPKGLDPRSIGAVLFSSTLSGVQFGANDFRDVAWAGRVPTVEPNPYARFAIEATPTAWAASTTYTVGVCASYDGKAYRCKTEHTSGSTFDASKWDEIPVLAQKADKPATFTTGNLAKFDSEGNPTNSGWTAGDLARYALMTKAMQQSISLPASALPVTYDGTPPAGWDADNITFVDMSDSIWMYVGTYNAAAFDKTTLGLVGGDANLRFNGVAASPVLVATNAVVLSDRACNYVDARTLGSSDSLDVDFPALEDGKSRDFVLAVECGANPPTVSYAALVTIMAEDASTLAPEEGMNIYAFTEFKTNMFLASRKTVSAVVVNTP